MPDQIVEVENLKKFSHTIIAEEIKADLEAAKKENRAPRDESSFVLTILGRAMKMQVKSNNMGEYLRFDGDFEARIGTRVVRSHTFYAPNILEMELGSAVASLLREGGNFQGMDFAVQVWRVPSEKSATKYEYRFKHLLKPEAPDMLAIIAARVPGLAPLAALPAPAPAPEPETPAPAPATTPAPAPVTTKRGK